MLSIEGLSYRYPRGADDVLKDVTLAIPAGGIFGLLGPNGAGKTTLISIVAGQLAGASGRVAFGGEALAALRRARPQCLGLVPQDHAFYPMLTCLENLRFFAGGLDDVLCDASNLLTLRLRAPLPRWLAAEWGSRYALADDGEARYRLRLPDASAIAGTIESARAAGCEPLAVAYGQRDLEQLFMQLTHRSLRD